MTVHPALSVAKHAATNIARCVCTVLEAAETPSRTINIENSPAASLSPNTGGCDRFFNVPCHIPNRALQQVSLQDLQNALRQAVELLDLVDRGLETPTAPKPVIDRIGEIMGTPF